MIKFDVNNRWTGDIQFTAEIDCAESENTYIKLGLAVKWAYKTGANLVGASLDGARLDGASLDGANLDGANLDGANLVGASLDGANLVGASLDGALIGRHTLAAGKSWATLGWPDGWFSYTFVTKEGEHRVMIGCQDKTISEGRAYWANKENRREVFASLDYAEAIGRARGWIKGTNQ